MMRVARTVGKGAHENSSDKSDSEGSNSLGPDDGACGEVGFGCEEQIQNDSRVVAEEYVGSSDVESKTTVAERIQWVDQQGNQTGDSEFEVNTFKVYKRKRSATRRESKPEDKMGSSETNSVSESYKEEIVAGVTGVEEVERFRAWMSEVNILMHTKDVTFTPNQLAKIKEMQKTFDDMDEFYDQGKDANLRGLESGSRATSKITSGGAVWDIFRREDILKLKEYLRKHCKEFCHFHCEPLENVIDPISDQSFFLNERHKIQLRAECGIEPWTFEQNLGEAVFIPAGCPHQVRNKKSCIQVALDFVSAENVQECVRLSEELRDRAQADKLEVKKMTLYAVSAAVEEALKLKSELYSCASIASEDLLQETERAVLQEKDDNNVDQARSINEGEIEDAEMSPASVGKEASEAGLRGALRTVNNEHTGMEVVPTMSKERVEETEGRAEAPLPTPDGCGIVTKQGVEGKDACAEGKAITAPTPGYQVNKEHTGAEEVPTFTNQFVEERIACSESRNNGGSATVCIGGLEVHREKVTQYKRLTEKFGKIVQKEVTSHNKEVLEAGLRSLFKALEDIGSITQETVTQENINDWEARVSDFVAWGLTVGWLQGHVQCYKNWLIKRPSVDLTGAVDTIGKKHIEEIENLLKPF